MSKEIAREDANGEELQSIKRRKVDLTLICTYCVRYTYTYLCLYICTPTYVAQMQLNVR